MSNVTPLLKCACGSAGGRRVVSCDTFERSIIACDACFNKTRAYLGHVRPIFDKMIECGISRGVANRTMSFMLEAADA